MDPLIAVILSGGGLIWPPESKDLRLGGLYAADLGLILLRGALAAARALQTGRKTAAAFFSPMPLRLNAAKRLDY
jgi:hypothetical protein